MIPSWFKVGSYVWFMGFGSKVEVISIDDGEYSIDDNSDWIGKDLDGFHKYPLDEVNKYWFNYHIDWK